MSKDDGIQKFLDRSKQYERDPEVQKETLRNIVTDEILEAMHTKNFKKADLAKALGTSAANVTQILNGNRNLTLDTLCEIAMALGMRVDVQLVGTSACRFIEGNQWFQVSRTSCEDEVLDNALA